MPASAGRVTHREGEALPCVSSDETELPRRDPKGAGRSLLEQAFAREKIDPSFSEHSHGFRPGRRAHDAVLSAQRYVQQGRHIVVDVDLSKFFDRVNHDILIDRLRKRVNDPGLIRLVFTCAARRRESG